MTLLDLAQKHVTLKRRTAKQWNGPCPKCGGTDRFCIWVDEARFWCSGCDIKGGVVDFLRIVADMKCPEAHAAAGVECTSTSCPALDKCRKGRGNTPQRPANATPQPQRREDTGFRPAEAVTPQDLWRQRAEKLVAWAHEQLLGSPQRLDYLAGRGLPLPAVQRFRLGLIPEDLYRSRESWGLPTELREDDGKPKKLKIPAGIVIPFMDADGVHRIRIRRWEGEPRYYWLPGSGNDVVIINPEARAFAAIETDLDALMVVHQCGDLIGAIPLGTNQAKPKASAIEILRGALCILCAHDADRGGAIGWPWWRENFRDTAERWPVPVEHGKDPGEAYQNGLDIRQWIIKGLPPGLRPVVNKPVDTVSESRNSEQVSASPEPGSRNPEQVFTLKARDGRTFHVTDDPAEYRRLCAVGEIVFNSREMARIRELGATPEQAAYFLDVKLAFPDIDIRTMDAKPWPQEEPPQGQLFA